MLADLISVVPKWGVQDSSECDQDASKERGRENLRGLGHCCLILEEVSGPAVHHADKAHNYGSCRGQERGDSCSGEAKEAEGAGGGFACGDGKR